MRLWGPQATSTKGTPPLQNLGRKGACYEGCAVSFMVLLSWNFQQGILSSCGILNRIHLPGEVPWPPRLKRDVLLITKSHLPFPFRACSRPQVVHSE